MTSDRVLVIRPGEAPAAHPLAEIFPDLVGGAYLPLATDIARRRVFDPVLLYEGMLLDGRARARAAAEAGQDCPALVLRPDADPIAILVSRNLARRHLDESQRAMVAARLASARQGDRTDLRPDADLVQICTKSKAASLLSVGPRSVASARTVLQEGVPELARRVERGSVAVSVAAEIARAAPAEQARILDFPRREILLAARQIRAERQAEKHAARLEHHAAIAATPAPWPAGPRYPVIYADPAWPHETWSKETGQDRSAENHYPTETLDEIRARPVGTLAADSAVLFLWAKPPLLDVAIDVMTASWGFRYVTNQVWLKDRTGTGYWFRFRHEHLLVGTRGAIPAPLMGTQDSSVLEAPWRGHSVKPHETAEMIERLYPNLPKIELYRRGAARPGWAAWGFEAEPASTMEGVA